MKSGDLRNTVTVQTPIEFKDTNGDDVTDWAVVGTYKAAIDPISVREQFLAEQRHASATHRIRFHWRAELAALTGKERVAFGSRIFVLIGLPENVDQRNREIRLLCLEGLREE